jgi:hypothetical protein
MARSVEVASPGPAETVGLNGRRGQSDQGVDVDACRSATRVVQRRCSGRISRG